MAAPLEPTSEQMLELLSRMAAGGGAGAAPDGGITVTPSPGFIIKTTVMGRPAGARATAPVPDEATATGRKVFINVCCNDSVAPFSRVKHLGESGAEEEGINVPVAVGPHREELDNGGRSCSVYDVIVHPGVVADCSRDTTGAFRQCIVQLAMGYVEKKFALSLSPRFRLPTGGYRGEPQPQRIRARPARAGIVEAGTDAGAAASPLQLLAEAGAVRQAAVPAGPGTDAAARAAAARLVAAAAARAGGPAPVAAAAAAPALRPRGGDLRSSSGGGGLDMELRVLPGPEEAAAGLVGAGLREAREGSAGEGGGGAAAEALLRQLGGAAAPSQAASAPAAASAPLLTPVSSSSSPGAALPSSTQKSGAAAGSGGVRDEASALRALLRDAALRSQPLALAPTLTAAVSSSLSSAEATPVLGDGAATVAEAEGSVLWTDVPCQSRAVEAEVKAKAPSGSAAPSSASAVFTVACTAAEPPALAVRLLRLTLRFPASLRVAVPSATHAYLARIAAATSRAPGGEASPPETAADEGGETVAIDASLPPPAAPPSVRLRAGGGSLSIDLAGHPHTAVYVSVAGGGGAVLGDAGAGAGASWHAASRTLVVTLALPAPPARLPTAAALREAAEAAKSEGGDGSGAASAALRAMLAACVEAPAALAAAPDAGSKQWLLAHALAEERAAAAPPAPAPPSSSSAAAAAPAAPAAPVREDDVLPEDAFLASDALSMHYVRQRAEDRAEREAKAKAQADAQAAAAAAAVAEARAAASEGLPVEGRAALAAVPAVAAALQGSAAAARALALL